jgi:uncharacterized cysteine cluster protein YcgN (CxxCxxCC family)
VKHRAPQSSNRLKAPTSPEKPFWEQKSLRAMTREEWESLCDGCGRCCLNKFIDGKGRAYFTDVACRLLDGASCRCKDYRNRSKQVKSCVTLTPRNLPSIRWLPNTCAYRLIAEGKKLQWWHPLISGDSETVHSAGISVRDQVVSESGLSDEEIENRIRRWPSRAFRQLTKS